MQKMSNRFQQKPLSIYRNIYTPFMIRSMSDRFIPVLRRFTTTALVSRHVMSSPERITSHRFQYPQGGWVTAYDYNGDDHCGWGLHGWPWARGCRSAAGKAMDGKVHMILAVPPRVGDIENFRLLDGKCKFGMGFVLYAGIDVDLAQAVLNRMAGDPRTVKRSTYIPPHTVNKKWPFITPFASPRHGL